MEQIDKYVNSVYKHVGGNKGEIETLKEEMRNHLLQIVEELKSEGKSEDESISIAIKRFGEETQIENELIGIFKFENKAAKKRLIVARSFLLMTVISFSIFVIGKEISVKNYNKKINEIYNIMSSYRQEDIESINENISKEFNESKKKIIYISMFRVPNGENMWHKDLQDLEYVYPKDFKISDIGDMNYDSSNKQITTQNGVKYNVKIGIVSTALIPMYIQNIGKSTLVWLFCFIISAFAWLLEKFDVHINTRH